MSLVYIIFILLAICFSFRYDGTDYNDYHKEHRYWLLCIYLICLAGFSYGLGGDKQSYLDNFELLQPDMSYKDCIYYNLLLHGYMPGWSILSLWVKRLFGSFYAIQFIQSTIVNVSICYLVQKYTKRYFLFLLLYFAWDFFNFNTEVMREAIAIAFCLYGIEAYLNGRKVVLWLFAALALTFHVSALIVLLFPIIYRIPIKLNWKTIYISTAIAFLFWGCSTFLVSKIFPLLLGSEGALSSKILNYLLINSTIFGFARNYVTNLLFPFIIMYFSYRQEPSEEIKQKKQHIITFFLIIGILAAAIPPFSRFRNYIEVYYLAMFADYVYLLFRKKQHLIMRLGVLIGILFLVTLKYTAYIETTKTYFYQYFVPYTSIMDNDKNMVKMRHIMHDNQTERNATDKNTRDID